MSRGAAEHPSAVELRLFVVSGEGSAVFDAHVSSCASCAGRLSQLARRAVTPVALAEPTPTETQRTLAVMVMAFAATLAVVMVQSIRLPMSSGAPEGEHGVVSPSPPRAVESVWPERPDSGVR